MQIFFQTKKIEINSHEKEFMVRRIEGLKKFFSPDVSVRIDVEQTHESNSGHDLFYVSIRVEDTPHKYFAEEYKDDIRKSFDHAYASTTVLFSRVFFAMTPTGAYHIRSVNSEQGVIWRSIRA